MTFEQRYHDGSYLAETGSWHDGDAAWKAHHLAQALDGAGWRPKRVADVGCGTGGVLVHLRDALPQAEFAGYELAEPAYRIAAGRAGPRLTFHLGSLLDDPGAPFDLVLAIDVFEHVPDYLGFLERLRPRGRAFAFHIPLDLSVRTVWQRGMGAKRASVGHLHYFTAETARETLRDTGYCIVAERFTHALLQPPPRGWRARARALPHRLLFGADRALCARLLGGCSLLVLAEPG